MVGLRPTPVSPGSEGTNNEIGKIVGGNNEGKDVGGFDEGDQLEEEPGGRGARPGADPGTPTKEEIAKHNIAHIPFRSWCPHCVRGRGRARPHPAHSPGGERDIPTVATDYCFIGLGTDDKECPVMVSVDSATGAVFANVVNRKGPDEGAVAPLMSDIEFLGHRRLTFKTDQEPALVAVQREIAMKHPGITLENSPVGEPQSNGRVENTVGRLKGMVRTIKSATESRLNEEIPKDSPILENMVEYAAVLMNLFIVNSAGKTAYQMIKGTAFTRDIPEFAERILFKTNGNKVSKDPLESDWNYGTYGAWT